MEDSLVLTSGSHRQVPPPGAMCWTEKNIGFGVRTECEFWFVTGFGFYKKYTFSVLSHGELEAVPVITVNYPNKPGSWALLRMCLGTLLFPVFFPHKPPLSHLPTPILGSSWDSFQNRKGKQ